MRVFVVMAVGFAVLAGGSSIAGEQVDIELRFDEGMVAYYSGNYGKAMEVWRPLAKEGHARAQFHVGRLYGRGEGVPQDFLKAVGWYKKAGAIGDRHALFELGEIHLHGTGVRRAPWKAARYHAKALVAGEERSRAVLDSFFGIAHMDPVDWRKVVKRLKVGAKEGDAFAQFLLAEAYVFPVGVPCGEDLSDLWYEKAWKSGEIEDWMNLFLSVYVIDHVGFSEGEKLCGSPNDHRPRPPKNIIDPINTGEPVL